MISQIVSVPKVRVSLPTLSCPPNRTETSPQVWFFPKPPSAGYSLDDITAESRANAARLNTTEGNFFCFIGAGSLKDKSVAQSFTGVDQLPEFPRFFFLIGVAMTYEVSPTYRLPASPEGTNGVQGLQLPSS